MNNITKVVEIVFRISDLLSNRSNSENYKKKTDEMMQILNKRI